MVRYAATTSCRKCFVIKSPGFFVPFTWPTSITFSWTLSCNSNSLACKCLILPGPKRLAVPGAAFESNHNFGVPVNSISTSIIKFFKYIIYKAHDVPARSSASPELIAGNPTWVLDAAYTSEPPTYIAHPLVLRRVSSHPIQSLSE